MYTVQSLACYHPHIMFRYLFSTRLVRTKPKPTSVFVYHILSLETLSEDPD